MTMDEPAVIVEMIEVAEPENEPQMDAGAPPRPSNEQQHRAAHRAVQQTSAHLTLPVVGTVTLPPPQHLAWYAGIGALAALEIIEWPVAIALAVGKALTDDRSNRTVEALGEALEDAG